jgi:hypothetical protein
MMILDLQRLRVTIDHDTLKMLDPVFTASLHEHISQ